MKKEYIKPSMKVVGINIESMILAGSGNLSGGANITSASDFESADEGVYFYDYDDGGESDSNVDF